MDDIHPEDLAILSAAECPGCGHIGDHGTGCSYALDYTIRDNFTPVSERLRLHYIEGAHAGLRGEWARIIREETAMLAEISRRYRRYRRDMREEQRVGQYLPTLAGYGEEIDQEVF